MNQQKIQEKYRVNLSTDLEKLLNESRKSNKLVDSKNACPEMIKNMHQKIKRNQDFFQQKYHYYDNQLNKLDNEILQLKKIKQVETKKPVLDKFNIQNQNQIVNILEKKFNQLYQNCQKEILEKKQKNTHLFKSIRNKVQQVKNKLQIQQDNRNQAAQFMIAQFGQVILNLQKSLQNQKKMRIKSYEQITRQIEQMQYQFQKKIEQEKQIRKNQQIIILQLVQKTFMSLQQRYIKRFVGGNWKCNNTLSQTENLVNILNQFKFDQSKVDVVVAPIYIHLQKVQKSIQKSIKVAAQNCSPQGTGAFTGQISPIQLIDFGIDSTIIGHSQRRSHNAQTDDLIGKKVKFALSSGLKIIVCFGQKLEQRQSKETIKVIQNQLNNIQNNVQKDKWINVVLAYEPVWAIGTGKNATVQEVKEVHDWIRDYLNKNLGQEIGKTIRIIYGGSVNQKNCSDLIKVENVDGFLVGGASLKPAFLQIIKSCE